MHAFQWGLSDGTSLTAKNRALTGGSRQEDGAADLPLNYMQGLGTFTYLFGVHSSVRAQCV